MMEFTTLGKVIGYIFLFMGVYGFLFCAACSLGRFIGGPRDKEED